MSTTIGSEREWFYIDSVGGTQKGPVPATVLSKLLEKGIGVSAQTLVWKVTMESWLPMSNVEPFQSIVAFQAVQWYYLDSEKQQQGPIISRLIVHKLKQGDLNEFTLVYGGNLSEWKPISEVPELKHEMVKIALDEQALQQTTAAPVENSSIQQVYTGSNFTTDECITPSYPSQTEEDTTNDGGSKPLEKKSFIGDNGVKYGWDDEEQDWVEMEDDDEDMVFSDEEDEDNTTITNKKRKATDTADDANTTDSTVSGTNETTTAISQPKKKRSKKKSRNKAPNTWVYVTGLPRDVTAEEIKDHFSKVGLIALSPYDQQPYIKLYRDEETGYCKGDCTLCYNAEESATTAVDFLDGGYIRPTHKVTVKKADFTSGGAATESNGSSSSAHGGGKKASLSHAQIKVARHAIQQALTWNEDDDIGVSRAAALRIVVLEGMFTVSDFRGSDGESFGEELEGDVAGECEKCGAIEKITVFSKNPRGVVVVKFATSYGAQECVKLMNGRFFGGRKIKCIFWDGVTNYSVVHSAAAAREEAAAEKLEASRLGEFGDWLDQEQEELPEEFRLRTE